MNKLRVSISSIVTNSFILSLLFITCAYSQNITFDKSYCGTHTSSTGVTYGNSTFIQTPDSGFLISVRYRNGPEYFPYNLKIDKYGNTQWSRIWNNNWQDHSLVCWQIFCRSAVKYDLTGIIWHSSPTGSWDYGYDYSIDSSGNYLGGHYYYRGLITDTLSDGFISADFEPGPGSMQDDITLLRIDSSGTVLWRKIYANPANEAPQNVIHTNDNGFLITGQGFYANNDTYLILMKTDSSGNIQWHKQLYSSTNFYVPRGVIQTIDSNIYVLAATLSGTTLGDLIIIKMDISGNILSCHRYSAQNNLGAGLFFLSKDNTFIISTASGIVKIDLNGNVIWTKNYIGYAIPTLDTGVAILNYVNDTISPLNDINIIKTDQYGNSCNPGNSFIVSDTLETLIDFPTTFTLSSPSTFSFPLSCTFTLGSGEETNCLSTNIYSQEEIQNPFKLFPNPFTSYLDVTGEINDKVEITLFDIASRKLLHKVFINSVSLNTEQLAKGIYFYEVRNKNGAVKKGKVVKD